MRFLRSSRVWSVIVVAALAGCLGRPEIEERWTHVELVSSNIDPTVPVVLGTDVIQGRVRVTFREILTGFLVAELRASNDLLYDMVELNPQEQRIGTARDVDAILQRSVTAGREVHAITGYPQLQREMEFTFDPFDANVLLPGATNALYLVVYLGEGEEIELEDGRDSLVVTPFYSSEYDILTQGIAVPLDDPAAP